jgi:UDP-N-acetylglucosamine--N-acetylmuramyl-(pentapeptide) pyrophosphoryl-undecaprenol N-acetylglucosamine transferase
MENNRKSVGHQGGRCTVGEACVVFVGGGTAGHVYPGLSIIEAMRRGPEIHWIGSRRGIEGGLVAAAGIPFHAIPAGKLRRYLSLQNVLDVFRVGAALVASVALLARLRPALVFSKGGYVSVPPVIAARLLRIPVLTHESDFDPGLATRINARFADLILTSFEETGRFFPHTLKGRVLTVGNPVRASFGSADPAEGRRLLRLDGARPIVVVLGGSLGSRSINSLFQAIAAELAATCTLVHQTGEGAAQAETMTWAHYHRLPFIGSEMPHVLAAADLVVCRAGAGTLAELAVVGAPAILIPLTLGGSRGDQIRNAGLFADVGAAEVFDETSGTAAELLARIRALLADPSRREAMRGKMRSLARPEAARQAAMLIEDRLA